MAETVHLTLIRVGSSDEQIEGDSTQTSLGREGTIECVAYDQQVRLPYSTSGATGRRTYQPLRITKRLDRASPLLVRALVQSEQLRATFRFYRPSPSGSGATEQFHTVALQGARIVTVRQWVPDVLDADLAARPPLEEVAFAFRTITWTWTAGGVEFEDTWTGVA